MQDCEDATKEIPFIGRASGDLVGLLEARTASAGSVSLPVTILQVLREAIVSGRLRAGTRLLEAHLARHLNTSRTPVRQALIQLEHEKLVVIVPRASAYVRRVTERDVEEIYEIRGALEALATSLAIKHLTPVRIAQLEEALEEIRRADIASDEAVAATLDRFHALVIRLSHNVTLEQIYENLVGPIRRLRRINLHGRARIEESLRANLRVAQAIVSSDPDAPRYMSEHLAEVCLQIREAARLDQSRETSI